MAILMQVGASQHSRLMRAVKEPLQTEPYQVRSAHSTSASVSPGGVDCSWSDWAAWSPCSTTGGEGSKRRGRRVAMAQTPGGEPCEGPSEQYASCFTCWTDWGTWSDCEGGLRHRARARLGAVHCGGDSFEEESCPPCAWTSWSTCSRSCGGGVRNRLLQGGSSSCAASEEELCNLKACDRSSSDDSDECFSDWEPWQDCSVTCGAGTRSRSRTTPGFCAGDLRQSEPCEVCCASDWSSWSPCAGPCKGSKATRSRARTVLPLQPVLPHTRCDFRPQEDMPCDCGAGDEEQQAHDAREAAGEAQAAGEALSSQVDCVWSSWQEWEACSRSCAGGLSWRRRNVKVQANDLGQDCAGPDKQSRHCNEQVPCPSCMSSWSAWSECTGPCDLVSSRSFRTREPVPGCDQSVQEERACSCGKMPEAGGDTEDNEDAATTEESLDCLWSDWHEWEACNCRSVTHRTRQILQQARGAGQDCPGEARQTRNCEGPCLCELSTWSSWSSCAGHCDGRFDRTIRTRELLSEGPCNEVLEEEKACSCGDDFKDLMTPADLRNGVLTRVSTLEPTPETTRQATMTPTEESEINASRVSGDLELLVSLEPVAFAALPGAEDAAVAAIAQLAQQPVAAVHASLMPSSTPRSVDCWYTLVTGSSSEAELVAHLLRSRRKEEITAALRRRLTSMEVDVQAMQLSAKVSQEET